MRTVLAEENLRVMLFAVVRVRGVPPPYAGMRDANGMGSSVTLYVYMSQ